MKYILIGAGGQASETTYIYLSHPMFDYYPLRGYVVDQVYGRQGDIVNGLPILGDLEWLREQDNIAALCAVGYPGPRRHLVSRAGNVEWFTINSALHCYTTEIGDGCLISPGAIIMNNIQIGNHVILNIASSVSHDSTLGDYCTLSPGAHVAGNCTLGEGVFMGMNSCVVEGINIGAWAKIGAGAVVLEDVPPNSTVVGVPGRIVK